MSEEIEIFKKHFKKIRDAKVKSLVEHEEHFPDMDVTLKHSFPTEIEGKVLVVSFTLEDED